MKTPLFAPTAQQVRIIDHTGSAFVAACPGAGKTYVMVERARRLLRSAPPGRGIAFLSFTQAAVSEFDERLRREGLVDVPAFPHFIGTFDAFLWQFLIAPFGVENCPTRPRLIPDKDSREVKPFPNAQPLSLDCFDRRTGRAIPRRLKGQRIPGNLPAYEGHARRMRERSVQRGELDFSDARDVAMRRLLDQMHGAILGPAFAARFVELIVDEAQDCNPMDLDIIAWFRNAGVPVTVVCDPNQAIYGFRGGVSHELTQFARGFATCDQLPATGNFRSSRNITRAIAALRAPHSRGEPDEALGRFRDDTSPVFILAYPGTAVPASIGAKFRELSSGLNIDARQCPVVSATRGAGPSALGHPKDSDSRDLTYRLALAVTEFHLAAELSGRRDALASIHRVMLAVGGGLVGTTYGEHLADTLEETHSWRSLAIRIADRLHFTPERFADPDQWLVSAKELLGPLLPPAGTRSIHQVLRNNRELASVLTRRTPTGHPSRTIHNVKGHEFPGICVVMTSKFATAIIDFLHGATNNSEIEEEARKIFVGSSRAQRLLAIALPRTQAARLHSLMVGMAGDVELIQLGN